WYLTSVSDPWGNQFTVQYYQGGPCWLAPYCAPHEIDAQHPLPDTWMKCPAGIASWLPSSITLPSGATISVVLKASGNTSGHIDYFSFPVLVNDVQDTRNWNLDYQVDESAFTACSPSGLSRVYKISGIRLPSDIPGAPAYTFGYGTSSCFDYLYMKQMTVPTLATINYFWGGYNFYHGRPSFGNCNPHGPI